MSTTDFDFDKARKQLENVMHDLRGIDRDITAAQKRNYELTFKIGDLLDQFVDAEKERQKAEAATPPRVSAALERRHPYTCGKDSQHRPLVSGGVGRLKCLDCNYEQWLFVAAADEEVRLTPDVLETVISGVPQ